MYQSALTFVT